MSEDILTALGYSRSEKRQLRRDIAKRLGPFQFENRSDLLDHGPSWRTGMWASGLYHVQEKTESNGWRRAMIGRHDRKPGIDWPTLQRIKQTIYGDQWAVQCFPPQDEVSDVANLYWLFVAPEGWEPEWKCR